MWARETVGAASRALPTATHRWSVAASVALGAVLLGRAASAAWLFRSGFESLSADGYLRTLLAADWAARPYLGASGVWLPGHMVALGSLLALSGDLVVAPRLFSLALGLVSIALVAAIGATLFGNGWAGVVAALLLATNPVHLWVSATPLSENLFLALVLLAVFAVVRFDRGGSGAWIAAAGAALALANTVRFEAWLVTIAFGALVAWWWVHKRLRLAALVAPMLAGLVPVVVILSNWTALGDPFFWPRAFQAYNLRAYGPGPDPAGVFEALWIAEGPLLILPAAAIGWAVRQDGPVRRYLVLVGCPIAVVMLGLVAGREPTNNLLRYLAPALAMLTPLVGGMVRALWERARCRPALAAASLMLAVALVSARTVNAGNPPREPSNDGLAVGQRVAALRTSGPLPAGPLIADSSGLAVYAMMVGANDIETILLDRPSDPVARVPPILSLEGGQVAACVRHFGAVGVITRAPELASPAGAWPLEQVNGFWIIRVEPADGPCPGETARWPDFARDATGRLFAALAYRKEE